MGQIENSPGALLTIKDIKMARIYPSTKCARHKRFCRLSKEQIDCTVSQFFQNIVKEGQMFKLYRNRLTVI